MTLYLTDVTSAEEITKAKAAGVVAVKLYPAGATTNSDAGVTDIHRTLPALKRMEYWICRAARRAMRCLGELAAIAAERLGAITAMPVLPVYMRREANLDYVRNWMRGIIDATMEQPLEAPIGLLKRLLSLERHFQGRPWHRRFAPP
jgi:hypothetical protein